MTSITGIGTATAVLPLPAPLRLGAMTVTRREYSAVRATADDGTHGVAYCLSREAPMAEIVDRLVAAHAAGADADAPAETWDRMLRGSAIVGRVGLVRRAIGLVDIALWDIAARRAGVPLWRMLGTGDEPRPSMLVAAYPAPGRAPREVADEVLGQAAGWTTVKISRLLDPAYMRELIAILNRELPAGTGLVVDVGFGWRDADQAIAEIAQWGDPELAWLEDPLLPEDAEGALRIRRASGLPVSVGDEVTDPAVLRALVERGGVDVLRLDVVAIGGITPAREMIGWAAERGVPVSGHVYPEVTAHLGIGVETFARAGNPYDPAPSFVRGGPRFEGLVRPSPEPGLGFDLDPEVFDFDGSAR
ncbi:L-alanine-DL-glutamate epimerase-like enolase superfamily enzyme [Microbacterium resistens]|uniref:L-alanine-DL-glutamate epimerase-like enolase superfamily enzyme n=1 Tax=Microbacterium resistens TaxID=156977 RepID=A0ABU1SBV8_9MICO|nr:enolase C-terminal domain-like protein [Microbacterium resistens]MDR6867095.1 L-alanine-DL-glutamate epimerase-like enolase superfamily enzyme [Microbacterium resistens]